MEKNNKRPEGSIDCARFNELCAISANKPIKIFVASHEYRCFNTKVMNKARLVLEARDNVMHSYLGIAWDGTKTNAHYDAALDRNLPLNGYNDWFLFEDPEAAARFALEGFKAFHTREYDRVA